ncbi:11300_t:CDS:2 [Ambispora gerdemannii]|uniref:11300_t:CDS:1 n=1 Tax=Ambispora gerdemannii TaxID=144530 RepID=A0A9N9DCI1_9GLOM|nr:11300_t:CDS:2 [Ambispora gerdemannii]
MSVPIFTSARTYTPDNSSGDSAATSTSTSELEKKLNFTGKRQQIGMILAKLHCDLNRVANFMQDIGQKVKVKFPDGILMNYSVSKTAAQILQDADTLEDKVMNITGHRSFQG